VDYKEWAWIVSQRRRRKRCLEKSIKKGVARYHKNSLKTSTLRRERHIIMPEGKDWGLG
jgi:hypothetical protein